ncbi:MAG: LutC/YkgG family protein, partial [Acidobacteriota bacterium]
ENAAARAGILARVRKAMGRAGPDEAKLAEANAYIAGHAHGPRPAMPVDLVGRFAERALDMASTLERIADRGEIPGAVRRYVDAMRIDGRERDGVCWPELADLDWAGAGLAIQNRPTAGDDRLGITGVYCAIAETGTLVVLSGANAPTATTLLPDTHIAVVSAARIVGGMEEMFALVRAERTQLPRALNMISGPSRTGDIEQTIVLGAHGPFRVHILLLP